VNHEIPSNTENQGRVLIADDEEIFLLATADLLRAEGYTVDCAQDVAQAQRLLRENSYDLLVSDIHMPGNPDLDLLKHIPESNQGLPVILVTGYPSAETAIQAIDLNALTYLVKPLEFKDLLERVREGIKQRRIQQAILASSGRVQDWAKEMGDLATGLGKSPHAGVISVQQMLGMVLGRMGETLLDLKHLVDLSAVPQGTPQDACSVQQCPRLEMYERIIREGIDTLEHTKGAFKSRELGDLRQKLEQMVEGKTGPSPSGVGSISTP